MPLELPKVFHDCILPQYVGALCQVGLRMLRNDETVRSKTKTHECFKLGHIVMRVERWKELVTERINVSFDNEALKTRIEIEVDKARNYCAGLHHELHMSLSAPANHACREFLSDFSKMEHQMSIRPAPNLIEGLD